MGTPQSLVGGGGATTSHCGPTMGSVARPTGRGGAGSAPHEARSWGGRAYVARRQGGATYVARSSPSWTWALNDNGPATQWVAGPRLPTHKRNAARLGNIGLLSVEVTHRSKPPCLATRGVETACFIPSRQAQHRRSQPQALAGRGSMALPSHRTL